jgi:putative transposase
LGENNVRFDKKRQVTNRKKRIAELLHKGVCADDGYRGTFVNFVTTTLHKIVEISKKISQKWAIIAKRWIVERTFAWFNNFGRLAKDYEISVKSSENIAIISHIVILIQRF